MRSRTLWPLLVLVTALLIPRLSRADQPALTDEQKKAANVHFKQGRAFFQEKQYDRAIEHYQKGYEISKWPGFLFNIALAREAKGETVKAFELYKKYLELDPKGQASSEAASYIARLTPVVNKIRAELARKKALAEAEARRKRLAAEAEARRKAAAAAAERERQRRERERRRRARERERRGRLFRIGGLALAGVGVVSLGLGVKFGIDARNHSNAISEHDSGPWTDELLGRADKGKTANTRMKVFTTIGGAAMLVGGAVYFWGRRLRGRASESPTQLSLQPVVGPRGALVALAGRF